VFYGGVQAAETMPKLWISPDTILSFGSDSASGINTRRDARLP
jgi:hypothetical protein